MSKTRLTVNQEAWATLEIEVNDPTDVDEVIRAIHEANAMAWSEYDPCKTYVHPHGDEYGEALYEFDH